MSVYIGIINYKPNKVMVRFHYLLDIFHNITTVALYQCVYCIQVYICVAGPRKGEGRRELRLSLSIFINTETRRQRTGNKQFTQL